MGSASWLDGAPGLLRQRRCRPPPPGAARVLGVGWDEIDDVLTAVRWTATLGGAPRSYGMRKLRVLARLSLLAACVFVVSGSSASASSSGVLRLHLHRLPYTVDSYPMASGDYALLSLSQAVGHYVVFDDKTHHRTVLSPPDNCSMWGSAPFSATEATLDRVRGLDADNRLSSTNG